MTEKVLKIFYGGTINNDVFNVSLWKERVENLRRGLAVFELSSTSDGMASGDIFISGVENDYMSNIASSLVDSKCRYYISSSINFFPTLKNYAAYHYWDNDMQLSSCFVSGVMNGKTMTFSGDFFSDEEYLDLSSYYKNKDISNE